MWYKKAQRLVQGMFMDILNLFTEQQRELLFTNYKDGEKQSKRLNSIPVACLTINKLGYTFLITEIDPDCPRYAYALCDYDTNINFDLIDLEKLQQKAREINTVVRSYPDFQSNYNVAVYAKAAEDFGTLVVNEITNNFEPYLKKFAKGKNCDRMQDIDTLRKRFTW